MHARYKLARAPTIDFLSARTTVTLLSPRVDNQFRGSYNILPGYIHLVTPFIACTQTTPWDSRRESNMPRNNYYSGRATTKKISAAIIQSREARSRGGTVPAGGKAATAAAVASQLSKPIQIREARAQGGGVVKNGPAAKAQRRAAHARIFPQNKW